MTETTTTAQPRIGLTFCEQAGTGSYRSWFFTVNNYTENDYTAFINVSELLEYTWLVVGKEVGEQGTPHLQAAITLKKPMRFNAVRASYGNRVHVEKIRNQKAAFDYCKKEGDFFEDDNRKQGKRTDIDKLIETVNTGATLRNVAIEHPREFIKYPHGVEKYFTIFHNTSRPDDWTKLNHQWHFGPTSCGKTTYCKQLAREEFGSANRVGDEEDDEIFWIANIEQSNGFWNGYENQPVIIFDDIRKNLMMFHLWLRVLDTNPMTINIKNSTRKLSSTRIYITAPDDPIDMWDNHTEKVDQLVRRLNGGIFRWSYDETGWGKKEDVTKEMFTKAKLPIGMFHRMFNPLGLIPETQETIIIDDSDDDDDDDGRSINPTRLFESRTPPPAPKKAKR